MHLTRSPGVSDLAEMAALVQDRRSCRYAKPKLVFDSPERLDMLGQSVFEKIN